jgi:hypothetical protein
MALRSSICALALLAMAPAAALAFETVETLPFPSAGGFPAWPADAGRPWTLFAYAGPMYDSNPFRRSTGEESDVVARVGAGGRAVARVAGRQSVLLEGFGEYFDYDRFSEIDHFGYGLRGEWLWELGNQLDGAAGYSRRRRHADLGEFQVERRVMVTNERLFADGGYRFTPDWRLFGGAEYTRATRDVDEFAALDAGTLRAALTRTSPLGNAIGAEVRATRGEAPVDEVIAGTTTTVANNFDERELAATLAYALGAQLRVSGRAGHTERSYDELAGRDFSGATYRGRVEWLPGTKVILAFEAYKEPVSIIDIDASHVVLTGTTFGASWAPGFKLVFRATFLNERRLNQGDPSAAALGTPVRDETLRVWRFGAGWEPQRHWQLGAGLDIGERTSNQLGRDYDYVQVMLNARFDW